MRAMLLATDPMGYTGCCAAIRDMDLRDRLGLIEAPALVVIGAHDPATPPERGQYIVERIPGAQKTVLDTAHLSNIEAPDEFNRTIFNFLSGERR
jgi:3-oxoadipate enol-lactonase